jgi:hypothetical protein
MSEQDAMQGSRVDELRKAVLSLKLEEVQQFVYDLPPRPPAKLVTIRVVRDPQNPKERILQVKQDWSSITPKEQIAWTCPDGRLEIRFSRARNPFAGDSYEVARGGKIYSGRPVVRITKEQTYKYVILVTTPDGFFLTQTVALKVAPTAGPTKARTGKSK